MRWPVSWSPTRRLRRHDPSRARPCCIWRTDDHFTFLSVRTHDDYGAVTGEHRFLGVSRSTRCCYLAGEGVTPSQMGVEVVDERP